VAVEAALPPRPSTTHATPSRNWPWWGAPALTAFWYTAFVVYATWSVFDQVNVVVYPYVSPFFSTWIGFGLIKIPIIGILIPILAVIPLGLRGSCYYYRKSYFRSFFWDPPACAIRELKRGKYRGETRFPWVLNNYHRYFLILSIIVLIFLWVDVVHAFIYHGSFFVGLGSVIMLLNVILLSLYTFTCHSFRYLMGGWVDTFSRTAGGGLWHQTVMLLNRMNPRHGLYAWVSMFSVALTDVYIRLLMAGLFHEPRWIA
jgi:hypothetical protein